MIIGAALWTTIPTTLVRFEVLDNLHARLKLDSIYESHFSRISDISMEPFFHFQNNIFEQFSHSEFGFALLQLENADLNGHIAKHKLPYPSLLSSI